MGTGLILIISKILRRGSTFWGHFEGSNDFVQTTKCEILEIIFRDNNTLFGQVQDKSEEPSTLHWGLDTGWGASPTKRERTMCLASQSGII
jgi:hypothetical protein